MTTTRIAPADLAIGTILPSSNRVVERVTQDILAHFPAIDSCFARISYHGHGKGQPIDGYDEEAFAAAAEMLAHADVGVICWNGTRGAGLGFTPDRRLCERLTQRTGVKTITTALATLELFADLGVRRIAVLSSYSPDQGVNLARRFAEHGIELVAGLHLGITDNFAAARVDLDRIIQFARAAAARKDAEAILIWSTNLPGHAIAGTLEAELALPVLDSAAIGVRASLVALGVDLRPAAKLWRMFAAPQAALTAAASGD